MSEAEERYERAKRVGGILELEKLKSKMEKYIKENKNSEDLYLAGCGDGAYHFFGNN